MKLKEVPVDGAMVTGEISNESGQPVSGAVVRLEQSGKGIAKTQTDNSGSYRLRIDPVEGLYDLSATSGRYGNWQLGIRLNKGEIREAGITLREAVSIEGTLLMLDDKTPHVDVVVQAIAADSDYPTATVLSDEDGKYLFINLKPGRYKVRCYTLDGYIYYGEDKSLDISHASVLQVQPGKTLRSINLRFPPIKKGIWRNYTYFDGLGGNFVFDIYCDPDGIMWFAAGTCDGISQFDGENFINFSQEDGLTDSDTSCVHRDQDGAMWFGTGLYILGGGGVFRYYKGEFVNFTTKDGLPSNDVLAIDSDPKGALWFGTWDGGISRYDGREFRNFSTADGLSHNRVFDIFCAPDGMVWAATMYGVSCYNGRKFRNFTIEDGLPSNIVMEVYGAPDGMMWFGTYNGGVSRYDGSEFVNFSGEDGLASGRVIAIHRDPDGVMWFGTGSGISRFDGEGFINFTQIGHVINAIYRTGDGALWVASGGSGVYRYDDSAPGSFTTRDGLVSNDVRAIYRAQDGAIWIGTSSGVSRYDGSAEQYDDMTIVVVKRLENSDAP